MKAAFWNICGVLNSCMSLSNAIMYLCLSNGHTGDSWKRQQSKKYVVLKCKHNSLAVKPGEWKSGKRKHFLPPLNYAAHRNPLIGAFLMKASLGPRKIINYWNRWKSLVTHSGEGPPLHSLRQTSRVAVGEERGLGPANAFIGIAKFVVELGPNPGFWNGSHQIQFLSYRVFKFLSSEHCETGLLTLTFLTYFLVCT